MHGSLQSLLLDAVKEIDELKVYRKELPTAETRLVFCPNRTVFLDRVPSDLFDVLAAVSRHKTVAATIEECGLSDLTVCRTLLMLLREQILKPADPRARHREPFSQRSERDLHAELDDPVGRDTEELGRRAGVARQEGEQGLAPRLHGVLAGGEQGLPPR